MEMKKMLENCNEVLLRDYSQYEDGKCNTGGCYVFIQHYEKQPNGWKLSHRTSAWFNYCPCCGNFYGGDYCSCDGEYVLYSTQQVSEILAESWGDPDIVIEYK